MSKEKLESLKKTGLPGGNRRKLEFLEKTRSGQGKTGDSRRNGSVWSVWRTPKTLEEIGVNRSVKRKIRKPTENQIARNSWRKTGVVREDWTFWKTLRKPDKTSVDQEKQRARRKLDCLEARSEKTIEKLKFLEKFRSG